MRRVAFCTIADAGFLPRLLTMQRSLRAVSDDARLYVLCMDEEAREALGSLALAGVSLVGPDAVEAYRPALREAFSDRTLAERCWTVKPVFCRYLLDRHPEIEAVVYADSDLVFYSDPHVLLEQDETWSSLIVPHRSAPDHGWEASHGIFNAGLLAFRRGVEAGEILDWWSARCLEWCYARVEDGKFCDQKYLDDWPTRFRGVRVLDRPGAELAPWNAYRSRVERVGDTIAVDGAPLVFFHYQSLRLYRGLGLLVRLGLLSRRFRVVEADERLIWAIGRTYSVSPAELELLYEPYVRALAGALDEVRSLGVSVEESFVRLAPRKLASEVARRVLPRTLRKRPPPGPATTAPADRA